jgi:uncharacterized tellurite resistance protein B-like protein
MIIRIKQFFETRLVITAGTTPEEIEHKLKLTSAILMLEMIHVDEHAHEDEERAIRKILQQQFDLSKEETEELLELAHEEKMDATDYYRFTSLINENYSQEQKIKLVEQLWEIAYADKVIDRFEEHLVRKLAELLHVPHKHFIQAKHRVESTE